MKTKVLSALTFILFIGSQLFAQSGGPDAYGYTWKNQAAVGGPVYNWKDIKGTGTKITGLADDNRVGPFNMNWPFHFYWNDFSQFWVGSNGWISFQGTTTNIAAPFAVLPNTSAKNTIDPLLSDLTFVQKNNSAVPNASAWYWTNNTDTLIVQYDSVAFWVTGNANQYSGVNTFQIILSGVDSSVTFQYKLYTAASPTYDITGEGLKTGLENSTGSIALQVLNNAYPASNTAVKFYYPNPVTYIVHDVTPAWNQNSDNGGFFVSGPYSAAKAMSTDIANVGNHPDSTISVTGNIYDQSLVSVWSGSGNVFALGTGLDTVLNFPTPFAANTPGDYIYRAQTTCSTDINSGNDINDVEMVVADTTQPIVPLSFTTATSTSTVLSFGAGEGGGVYFVPPFYPATATSIDYFIGGTTGTAGFTAELFKDDGPNGAPGTRIDSIGVANTSVINAAYNTVNLTSSYVINSGGVYALWIAGGDSIQLGTDQGVPYSNRNFEYIGGSWAAYRNNSAEDLMINLNIQGSSTTATNNLNENGFTLSQNYPNPSGVITMINYSLPSSGEVQFSVKNILGQEMDAVNFGTQISGVHTLKMSTSKLAPGIYFYTLKFSDKEITKKMVVNR